MKEARKKTGLPIVTEIMRVSHIELFEDVDIIQVGARNMQNFELLKELGHIKKPILLKRGLSSTCLLYTSVGKLYAADLLALHIKHCYFRHSNSSFPYAFTLSRMTTVPPFGPGIAPLIAMRLFSASTLTTCRF